MNTDDMRNEEGVDENQQRQEQAMEDESKNAETWFNFWKIWHQLVLLREAAKRQGTEIINLTEGGVLDCFPRQNYEDVIKEKTKARK